MSEVSNFSKSLAILVHFLIRLAGGFFQFFFFIIYFWLHWVFIAARRLSLVAASGGYSSLRGCGFLIAVASLVAEHRL